MNLALRRIILLFLCFGLFSISGFTASFPPQSNPQGITFHFYTTELSNLCYQLDAMAGLEMGSGEVFRELWKNKIGWSAEDERLLAQWRECRQRYFESVKLGQLPEEPLYQPNPPVQPYVDLSKKIRIASLIATNVDDYQSALAVTVLPADAYQLTAILRSFQLRFHPWWETEGKRISEPFVKQFTDLMAQKNLTEFSNQVARFYESQIAPGYAINIFLMARPKSKNQHTSGEVFDNFSTVEVLEGERPEQRIDVVLHEVFHHFFSLSPVEKRIALVNAFARHPDPDSLAVYHILDEVLATALGNGLVFQKVSTSQYFEKFIAIDQSFYNDPFIDKTAKAMMPAIRKRIESGQSLFDGFVDEYVSTARQALGDRISDPHLRLFVRTSVLADAGFRPLAQELARGIRAGYSSTYVGNGLSPDALTAFETYPGMNGLVVLKSSQVKELESWEKILGKPALKQALQAAKKYRAFVLAVKRNPKSTIFLISGNDETSIGTVLKSLIQNHTPFEGVKFEVAQVK
ncbi:MAG: hypothetical protein HY774_24535 [Acidobacteria bacterium]|nr:hypothetical protein [Acidobacteriota bacterium]